MEMLAWPWCIFIQRLTTTHTAILAWLIVASSRTGQVAFMGRHNDRIPEPEPSHFQCIEIFCEAAASESFDRSLSSPNHQLPTL
jgi:hypothetical protein